MVKRKVSLGGAAGVASDPRGASAPADEADVLELFFNTGVVFHEVGLPSPLPDVVSSFVVMKDKGGRDGYSVRRATAGEEPDVEVSILENIGELENRWLPVPYQLSSPLVVQAYFAPDDSGKGHRVLLAIDTLETSGAAGRCLDAALDEGRPFRPLDKAESASVLDHPDTRELLRKLEKGGIDKAPFKLAAFLELLAPFLPRIRFSKVETIATVPVSLVLDFGNSRSSAVLVEAREKGVFAVPLEIRNTSNPFVTSAENFDSRIAFLPSPFDKAMFPVAVGDSFTMPSIARLGREALDRALETPHRYACSLSSPKRYLWDDGPAEDRWHFAAKLDGEHRPVFGRVLKYLADTADGLALRADGPSTPADARYAPRAMMLFALVEILSQAVSQINSVSYRKFQGKEQRPRALKHLVLTYPSGMREEEKQIYERLVQNAVVLVMGLLHIPEERWPNKTGADRNAFERFLFADEALAAQMVYVYQEIQHVYSGSMEEFVKVYGRTGNAVRVASVDIGGGTSDVMIAEYADKAPGTGTSLAIKKLFQDGIAIAGDEVCRALVEDVIFVQLLAQLPSTSGRQKIVHLFGEGDAGHGAAWRTLKAKLVPYFWLPLARCYWALAEGYEIPEHTSDKAYAIGDLFRLFPSLPWSASVLAEADRFLTAEAKDFPGLSNFSFRFDRAEVDKTIESVLREPLRRYADIIAQFDVDLVVLAGRASALRCIRDLFVAEMPVAAPRIKTMARYRVGDWYPSKWQENGFIKDAKSTVTAGAAVLHIASKNQLAGFLLDEVNTLPNRPIYGLYQNAEPHIGRSSELFRAGKTSPPFTYASGMMIGFRNVDSPEMDGSPLFEVVPASPEVEEALLEDRALLRFELLQNGGIAIASVKSQRDLNEFSTDDFRLRLKTATSDRYWLDTGVFKNILRYL